MERERKRRTPWIIVILLVAAVCAFSWLGALVIHKVSEGTEFGSYRAITGPANLEVQVAGDGFVTYDGSTLTCMDSTGSKRWTYLIGADADFCAGPSGVAAWTDKKVTLINSKNGTTVFSGEYETRVLSAKLGAKYAAVLLEGENGSSIVVSERGGRQVYTAQFDQVSVVDFGFFSSDSLLWAMSLDTTGSNPTCEITTYKPRSMAIVGAISDTEQLMYNVTFQSSSVCCTGVTYYKVYDYTGTELEKLRRLVYGWYLVSADTEDDPLMAFSPAGQADGEGQIQDVRMIRSNLDEIVHLPFGCTSLVARGNRVYGFSPDGHVMVAKPGNPGADAYRMPFFIDRVYGITSSGVAVVGSGATIYLITLSEE